MSDDAKPPRLRYVGDGFLPGVPARDLSDEETREHGGVRVLVATGLYESVVAKADNDKSDKPAAGKKAEGGE